MPDENKDQETDSEARQDEWSGTPFQGWRSPEDQESEKQGEQDQPEIAFEEAEVAEIEDLGQPGEAPGPDEAEEVSEMLAEAKAPAEEPVEQEPAVPAPSQNNAGQPVDYSRTFRSLEEGDVVEGVVVHIDKEGVLVDVGTKSEGLVRPGELSRNANVAPEEVVQVGDKIDVYVVQPEDQEGGLILSKKRADFERAWERVEEAHRTRKTLSAMVTDRVKGGLVVDLGIRGFVPASHVGSGKIKNLERYVGQSIPLKVIEVDRDRRKVVLSNRLAAEDERERQRAETLGTLAEGQVRAGIVRRLTEYGAFVDLGGIDGLLHISEMSWTRIKHPSDVVKVGEKIQVMILKLNLEQGKVSLGLRQILPDPWTEVERRYRVGDVITGRITRLVPFGAFVQVDGGVEGIIPNSELATRRVSKPEDVVSVGQEVEVRIIDLRPEERRMTLSIRSLQQQKDREQERSEMQSYTYSREDSRTTIGDLVGDMVREARVERRERRRRERQVEERQAQAEVEEVEHVLEEPMFVPEPGAEPKEPGAAEEVAAAEVAEPTEAEPAVEAAVEPESVPEEQEAAEPVELAEAEPAAEAEAAAEVTVTVEEAPEPATVEEPEEAPTVEEEAAEGQPEVAAEALTEAEPEVAVEAPAEAEAEAVAEAAAAEPLVEAESEVAAEAPAEVAEAVEASEEPQEQAEVEGKPDEPAEEPASEGEQT